MTRTTEERLDAVHAQAMSEFQASQSAGYQERQQCLQDRRFLLAGGQWEGGLSDQFNNRPKFEVNKIQLAVIRIFNEYRNNRIGVSFIPKNGAEQDKLADVCAGLLRSDEQDSSAEEAYDNAFEEGVSGGIGAWRLRCDYQDEEADDEEESEYQRVIIEPIYDADSCVFFDVNAKRQDKSDAMCAFVLTGMTHESFNEQYDKAPSNWNKTIHGDEFDWSPPDMVYTAEYYKVEKVKQVIHYFRDLDGNEEKFTADELDDDKLAMLQAIGSLESRQKTIKRTRVHKYILDGATVLKDCGFIAGRNIPIVTFYGKRWFVDGIERIMGHVRLAKDAQRLKNMQLSKLAEISALSTVEKPIFTPEQMTGHATMWANDNVKNYPFLIANALVDVNGNPISVGPQAYTRAPNIPPAMAALLQITETDLLDILGNQQAGEQLQSNVSGIAVELIQNKLDMQTFIYISNMSKAMKRSGQIWLSMAKDILIESGRKMKSLPEQGKAEGIELLRKVMNEQTGAVEYENDISKADFDIVAEVGPTSNSRRAATVRGLMGMMQVTQADPESQQVLGAMAMMNMEGEGIGDVRDFYRRKLVRMGAIKPTQDELAQMQGEAQNQVPDPNAEFLKASAEQASAAAAGSRAKTILTVAQAEKVKAETLEIMENTDQSTQSHAVDTMNKLMPQQ